jgi:hypothetical protein
LEGGVRLDFADKRRRDPRRRHARRLDHFARGALLTWLLLAAACGSDAAPPVVADVDNESLDASVATPSPDAGRLVDARVPSVTPPPPPTTNAPKDASAQRPPPPSDAGSPAELAAQGCDPSRPGFAYRAKKKQRSEAAEPPDQRAPIPCLTLTDAGSVESTISVANDGTVFYAPHFGAESIGVLRSQDRGRSWTTLVPKFPNGGEHGRVQPYSYLDPVTQRLFFATAASSGKNSPASSGFDLSISDDQGATWDYVQLAPDVGDWIKLFAGPRVSSASAGDAGTKGASARVMYASGPSPISTPVPVVSLIGLTPTYQSISRSYDGGKTWERVATPSLLPSSVEGCPANEWIIYGSGAVASDGTAYLVMRRCRELAISRTLDEGKTWQVHVIPGASLPPFNTGDLTGIVANPNVLVTELVTVDSTGNLYVVWVNADGELRYTYSKDRAETWSPSVIIAAPGVASVRYANVAVKLPGTIAVAYFGSLDGVHFDGYIAETDEAFADEPRFTSVIANPPQRSLYPWGFEVGYLGILAGADLNEIVQVKYAPDGDLWASFSQDMCEGANADKCEWDSKAHNNSLLQGAIGRLVHEVAETWSQPAAALPPPPSCDNAAKANAQQCDAYVQQYASNTCRDLRSCICDHCGCEFNACAADEKCRAVILCATANNCRGQECLLACQDQILAAGDLLTTRALAVATCANQNGCPVIQFCPLN